MIKWLIVVVTVVATIANIKFLWWGFALYMLTNAYWAIHNMRIGEKQQAVLYTLFFLLATWGVLSWLRK